MSLAAETRSDEVRVRVRVRGPGFADLAQTGADPALMRLYVDSVRFNRGGNAVMLVRRRVAQCLP